MDYVKYHEWKVYLKNKSTNKTIFLKKRSKRSLKLGNVPMEHYCTYCSDNQYMSSFYFLIPIFFFNSFSHSNYIKMINFSILFSFNCFLLQILLNVLLLFFYAEVNKKYFLIAHLKEIIIKEEKKLYFFLWKLQELGFPDTTTNMFIYFFHVKYHNRKTKRIVFSF